MKLCGGVDTEIFCSVLNYACQQYANECVSVYSSSRIITASLTALNTTINKYMSRFALQTTIVQQ